MSPRKVRQRSIRFETLEPRNMLASGVTASINSQGLLRIFGTDRDDKIFLSQSNSKISIKGISASWSTSRVNSIRIEMRGGNDYVSLDSLANGGKQILAESLNIYSGIGQERVRLANKRDAYFCGVGHRLTVTANGTKLNGAQYDWSDASPTPMGAGLSASLNSKGMLKIIGTNSADQIFFRQIDGKVSICGAAGSWATSKIKSIRVELNGGDDCVSLDSLANGGNQTLQESFNIYSGDGIERIKLADGHEVTLDEAGQRLTVTSKSVRLDGVIVVWDDPTPDPDPDPIPDPDPTPDPEPEPPPAGIIVTPTTGLVTTEAGGTATFTVVLNSQPTGDVTIGINSSNSAEGSVSLPSLLFTSQNWNTPQTVTVTGVNDFLDEGDVAYTIVTAAAVSTDSGYSNVNAADVTITNIDNDTAGVTVTPITGPTTEAGGTATFTVVLNSRPTADVTIGLSSSNPAEGTISQSSVVFTAQNWNTPQTVTITGVNDSVDDGDIGYTILTAAALSADGKYNNLSVADVTVTNIDNDTAGITVTPITGSTTEAGGTATFTVVLNSRPTADVTIGISSSNLAEGTVSHSSLVFTAQNWNTPQTVTVTGVNEFVDDGNVAYTILTAAAVSADGKYNSLNVADVAVTNIDNDTAGIIVTPTTGLVTTEAGGTAAFTVVLNSRPTANVTIGISSSNAAEGAVSQSSLVFTAQNWNTPQTITVTGVNDVVDDGDVAYTILTAAAVSADGKYNNLNAADVAVINVDDDPAQPPPATNWFDTNIVDADLKALGSSLYQDGLINRTDVMALFSTAQDGSVIDATEFNDLTSIVNNVSLFGGLDFVWKLSTYVVLGTSANTNYQGSALGNLVGGSSGQHLQKLVNKWFLGLDRPTDASYSLATGSLFVNGPSYADVNQHMTANCGIMSSLAEVAWRNSEIIVNMFTDNNNGTYTVRFYNLGVAEYVTVDSYLPGGYASVQSGELWVALAEKAAAQLNEFSWCRFGSYTPVGNSYDSIAYTHIFDALRHITGQSASGASLHLSLFVAEYNAGAMICFASKLSGTSLGVAANHAYAVVGYDPVAQTVTLFNPWGIQTGLLTLTWSQIQANFLYFDRTT